MAEITGHDVQDMIGHWLKTPVEGYLGSSYGQDAKAMLQNPLSADLADQFIGKLRDDVEVIDALPPAATNLYGMASGVDKLNIVLEVAGQAFQVG